MFIRERQRLYATLALAVGFVLVALVGCESSPTSTTHVPTPWPTSTTGNVKAKGTWLGEAGVTLTLYSPTISPDRLPDKEFQARIKFDQSDNSQYTCLVDSFFDVYSAPAEFPKLYIVFAQCPDQTPSTWVFPLTVNYTYSALWKTTQVSLILVSKQTTPIEKTRVEDLSDAVYQGLATSFQTNDPAYTCVNNTTPNVYTAQRSFPWTQNPQEAVYLIHFVCPDGTDGTWKFLALPPPGPFPIIYRYLATWQGHPVTLKLAPLPQPGIKTTATDSVMGFTTDNPQLQCFNNLPSGLNTYTVAGYPAGQYLVSDRCPLLAIPASWTFTVTTTGTQPGQ